MKVKLYLLSVLLLLYSSIVAQVVSPETAQHVANIFMQNKYDKTSRTIKNAPSNNISTIKPIGRVTQYPAMYAISMDSVWVLVSADERVTPILAYSDENSGSFPNEEDMPPAMLALLEWYEHQIQYLRDSTNETTIHEGWQTYQTTSDIEDIEIIVPPLLYKNGEENLWKQNSNNNGTIDINKSYNKFCPLTKEGKHSIVGCAAVAMGQLMWYWQWPKMAVVKDDNQNSLIREYNWDYMPAKLLNNTPVHHVDMIANLLHDAGVSVNMTYSDSASGAYTSRVPYALTNVFNYKTYSEKYRKNYQSQWLNLLKENLQKNYPILYSGVRLKDNGSTAGHLFVIDGYNSTDAFHINYGWGHSNGYYMLDTIKNVPYTKYYLNQTAILNIHPNYSSCSPIELSQNDIKNTKFIIQNTGGITIENKFIENNQEGIIYSNDYIKLSSGFHAKAGCNLHIAIKNDIECNDTQNVSYIQKHNTSESTKEQWCNQWNVLTHSYLEPDDELYGARTNIFQLGQDTIINNQEYATLTYYSSKKSIDEKSYVGALRFTNDKKVYIYYDNTEYLLYDFDVQVGDTLEIFGGMTYYKERKTLKHVITEIDTLDDNRLKITSDAFLRTDYDNWQIYEWPYTIVWIECVGSLNGIVHSDPTSMTGNLSNVLLCAYQNEEHIFTTIYPSYEVLGCIYNEGDVITTTEKVETPKPLVQKIIRNSEIFIIRDGKTYNIMGIEIEE